MNGAVRLVYTEFEPDQPPFAWFGGRRMAGDDDRSGVYWIMATIAAAAKVVERPGTRAMRYLDDGRTMLVELDLPDTDPGGAPLRLTVVLVVDRTTRRRLAEYAGQIVAELAQADITADKGRIYDALEWGRANSALRFRRINAWCRRIGAKVRRGNSPHPLREMESA